jgi:hypothetical protein
MAIRFAKGRAGYRRVTILPLMEDKERAHGDAGETKAVIPFEGIAEVGDGEHGEDRQGNHFLNGLQLRAGKLVRTDAVRGNLEAVLKECDAPARDNYFPERRIAIFQMPVPREGHKNVGDGQKGDGAQGSLRQDSGL